ncbi:MAG: tRNA (adenosine(37)-N6)-threonylcarbamoyltransferase complex ATPase subunit type 1 TsaE, partial [Candidatus Brocadiaceae bacterium]|nr:tRNA (adenosine(37)-N6)-threonylcarbamoyltransferase complex ATPase subunit type 1 TsaE [Candidatus Brocadiaceae bacterium]
KRAVKSPTFSLVHRYEGRIPLYHFDAYRLEDAHEMLDIGSDEIVYGNGVSVIEWADRVTECLPESYLKITIIVISGNKRNIEVCSYGMRYDIIMRFIEGGLI